MIQDNKDKALLCSSFSYDHLTFECIIYRHKAAPDGVLPIIEYPAKRYFEKFCLPKQAPVSCGEAQFFR